MANAFQGCSMTALTLNLDSIVRLTHDQFYRLCQENRDVRLALTATGALIVMPPTGWESGNRNIRLAARLQNWAEADATGMAFDSSTGFILPSGAVRSPDVAWVALERFTAMLKLSPEAFLPLAPDFVIELWSASDRLQPLQLKMREYVENGVRLGWLINPQDKAVEIYRVGGEVEVLRVPEALSGEDVLPGFVMKVQDIF